jgi:hypothetical protein
VLVGLYFFAGLGTCSYFFFFFFNGVCGQAYQPKQSLFFDFRRGAVNSSPVSNQNPRFMQTLTISHDCGCNNLLGSIAQLIVWLLGNSHHVLQESVFEGFHHASRPKVYDGGMFLSRCQSRKHTCGVGRPPQEN